MLTLAYITNRLRPHIEWFFESLHRECGGDYANINILVVDFWLEIQEHWPSLSVDYRIMEYFEKFKGGAKRHLRLTPCKPNVWSGPHRLTKENWWSNSSMRNTAICHAPDGYIALLDDRSVLLPGWLNYAREAMQGGYAAFGSYEKVMDCVVQGGNVIASGPLLGRDHRLAETAERDKAVRCSGQWCFGCNLVLPVEWALQVNGFDECCDGLSFEDVIFGLLLEKNGFDLRYDPRMMILEDRTPGQLEPTFRRTDKGISPDDKSHAILNMVLTGGRHVAPNFFGEGGIRALRQRILAGEPFPIVQCPDSDWFDGQKLADM